MYCKFLETNLSITNISPKKVCNFTSWDYLLLILLIYIMQITHKFVFYRKQCTMFWYGSEPYIYTSMGSFIVSSRIYITMSVCASLSFRLTVPLEGQKSRTLASLGSACQVKVTSPRNPTLRLTLSLTVVLCPYSS